MHSKEEKRWYTPQLSYTAIYLLRRLAWHKGQPMTKTLDNLVLEAAGKVNPAALCSTCRAKEGQCKVCPFKEGALSHKETRPSKQ